MENCPGWKAWDAVIAATRWSVLPLAIRRSVPLFVENKNKNNKKVCTLLPPLQFHSAEVGCSGGNQCGIFCNSFAFSMIFIDVPQIQNLGEPVRDSQAPH